MIERSRPKAKVPKPTLAAIAISARRLIMLIPLEESSRLAIVEFAIQNVAQGDILKPVQAPDRIELAHVDVTVCHAGGVDVEIHNLPYDQGVAVGAKLDHLMELAFEMDRHFGDARWLYLEGRELGPGEFVLIVRKAVGGIHHLLPHRRGDHIDAELARLADVLQRVLLAPIGVARDGERDHRRYDAHHGKERKRREIADAVDADGRSPADRPRHYRAREQSIDRSPLDHGGVIFEIGGHGSRRIVRFHPRAIVPAAESVLASRLPLRTSCRKSAAGRRATPGGACRRAGRGQPAPPPPPWSGRLPAGRAGSRNPASPPPRPPRRSRARPGRCRWRPADVPAGCPW